MGNFQCCQAMTEKQFEGKKATLSTKQPEIMTWPNINDTVADYLQQLSKRNQSYASLNKNIKPILINDKFYKGPINNENQPHGFGKMLLKNGSTVITNFQNGIPNGMTFFVMPDGSYYEGIVKDAKAQDLQGTFSCSAYTYKGSFKDSKFDGEGNIESKDGKYSYQGMFSKNKKTLGKLKWKESVRSEKGEGVQSQLEPYVIECAYEGGFDENQDFDGEGTLVSPKGTYKGHFKHGEKNGEGTFIYKNGYRYVGGYKDGMRNGNGTIYNQNGQIICESEFKDGLPSGKGKELGENNQLREVLWVEGVGYQPEQPQKP